MRARAETLAIIGAGALARAFVQALSKSPGIRVLVVARRFAAAKALARGHARVAAVAEPGDALRRAGIVLLAVADGALAPAARTLAKTRASWRGVVVLHAAGALGPELLAPFAKRGAATGVLHPMAALGTRGAEALRGALARIEGTAPARAAARRLAARLGLAPFVVAGRARNRDREIYHAAAALASNDLVALLSLAEAALARSGVPRARARRGIVAVARGALDQFGASGPAGALSGPVARGDAERVARHLAALAAIGPEAAGAHRALSSHLADLARDAGRIDAATARRIRTRVGAPPRGRTRRRTV